MYLFESFDFVALKEHMGGPSVWKCFWFFPCVFIIFNFQPPLADESNLLQQHESGLTSSAYELSQYIGDASELYNPMAPAALSPVQAGGYWSDLSNWLSLVRRGLVGNLLESHPSSVLLRVDHCLPHLFMQVSWAEKPFWLYFYLFSCTRDCIIGDS